MYKETHIFLKNLSFLYLFFQLKLINKGNEGLFSKKPISELHTLALLHVSQATNKKTYFSITVV